MADEWMGEDVVERDEAGGSTGEFDWIDDAFDDKKTAAEIEAAKGPKAAGCLLVVALLASVALVFFGMFGIVGALGA